MKEKQEKIIVKRNNNGYENFKEMLNNNHSPFLFYWL